MVAFVCFAWGEFAASRVSRRKANLWWIFQGFVSAQASVQTWFVKATDHVLMRRRGKMLNTVGGLWPAWQIGLLEPRVYFSGPSQTFASKFSHNWSTQRTLDDSKCKNTWWSHQTHLISNLSSATNPEWNTHPLFLSHSTSELNLIRMPNILRKKKHTPSSTAKPSL